MTCTIIRQIPFSHQPIFKVSLKGGSLTQVSLYVFYFISLEKSMLFSLEFSLWDCSNESCNRFGWRNKKNMSTFCFKNTFYLAFLVGHALVLIASDKQGNQISTYSSRKDLFFGGFFYQKMLKVFLFSTKTCCWYSLELQRHFSCVQTASVFIK